MKYLISILVLTTQAFAFESVIESIKNREHVNPWNPPTTIIERGKSIAGTDEIRIYSNKTLIPTLTHRIQGDVAIEPQIGLDNNNEPTIQYGILPRTISPLKAR